MFDLRYHIASLAAVFIAIAIGIVIGVAIGSGGAVEDTTRGVVQAENERLRNDLEAARERADEVEAQGRASAELLEEAYPVLMDGRLAGAEVVVLFLGPIDQGIRSDVERTLTDAGAGSPVRVMALDLPVDAEALEALIAADPALAAFGADGGLEGLGRGLGRELVLGGSTPVTEAADQLVVAENVGSTDAPATAVVIVRSLEPAEEGDPAGEQATNELVDGILSGLEDGSVALVGVERTGTEPSDVPFFGDHGLSSVDDVDALAGRVALAVLLAGGDPGSYGVGDGVDGASPPIEPVPAATVG